MLDGWIPAIDNIEIVGSLFIDLSKAFDLVYHTILIQKLSSYGLHNSDTDWFNSYLNSRTQISGEQPKPGEITAGVPHGSVLGPLLFLIYINDLPLSLSKSIVDIFADDTTLSVHNNSLDEVVTTLSFDLSQVDIWSKQNHMS